MNFWKPGTWKNQTFFRWINLSTSPKTIWRAQNWQKRCKNLFLMRPAAPIFDKSDEDLHTCLQTEANCTWIEYGPIGRDSNYWTIETGISKFYVFTFLWIRELKWDVRLHHIPSSQECPDDYKLCRVATASVVPSTGNLWVKWKLKRDHV